MDKAALEKRFKVSNFEKTNGKVVSGEYPGMGEVTLDRLKTVVARATVKKAWAEAMRDEFFPGADLE